jgi:hypothetical protein
LARRSERVGIDAEATKLFVATRDYLVGVWKGLVQRAVVASASDDAVGVVAAANSAADAWASA